MQPETPAGDPGRAVSGGCSVSCPHRSSALQASGFGLCVFVVWGEVWAGLGCSCAAARQEALTVPSLAAQK